MLIVDDNATNRRILERMLGRWGMRPATAAGAETMEMLREAHAEDAFRLILTNMHMPGANGFTLIERIRGDEELNAASAPTIMMLTSAGHSGDVARCRELGVATYLLKPIRKSELRGHRTALAANGVEVLAMLETRSFDVILMDVQMPLLDGVATTKEIRLRETKDGGIRRSML